MNKKFIPEPFTQKELDCVKIDWKLVCATDKRKNQTQFEAETDYSWSHYAVGRLLATIEKGIKLETYES